MKNTKLLANVIVILLFFSLSTSFLFFRAKQFDTNYPNPLTDELSAQTVKLQENSSEDYRCYLPPESGDCYGYIEKYYFDRNTKTCEKYVYGGCGAIVPFDSLDECTNSCLSD